MNIRGKNFHPRNNIPLNPQGEKSSIIVHRHDDADACMPVPCPKSTIPSDCSYSTAQLRPSPSIGKPDIHPVKHNDVKATSSAAVEETATGQASSRALGEAKESDRPSETVKNTEGKTPVSIMVHETEEDDKALQKRRRKRRRRIHRNGGIRFQTEDALETVHFVECAETEEDMQNLYWSSDDKQGFFETSIVKARSLCSDHPDSVEKLNRVYRRCGSKEYRENEAIGFTDVLHKAWINAHEDARGVEHECCSLIASDFVTSVNTILQYQDILLQSMVDSEDDEDYGDRRSALRDSDDYERFSKLLRRRSLDLTRRARKFAHFMAVADALEARQILNEREIQ